MKREQVCCTLCCMDRTGQDWKDGWVSPSGVGNVGIDLGEYVGM